MLTINSECLFGFLSADQHVHLLQDAFRQQIRNNAIAVGNVLAFLDIKGKIFVDIATSKQTKLLQGETAWGLSKSDAIQSHFTWSSFLKTLLLLLFTATYLV